MVEDRPAGRHLARGVAWVLVKAVFGVLRTPEPRSATGRVRPEPVSGDTVDHKIARSEAAVADARNAERQALSAVAAAGERADTVQAVTEAAERRIRQAVEAGEHQARRQVEELRGRLEALVELERVRVEREVTRWIGEIAEETDAEYRQARDEAQEAARQAQRLVDEARQQMTEARALATEAVAAAEAAAQQARASAGAIGPTPPRRPADTARRTRRAPARTPPLNQRTKAELVELARPLRVGGATRMTKDELVEAIRAGSRRRRRA